MNNRYRTGRAKRRRRHDGPLIEVKRGYNGSNNGRIVLSARQLADRLGCHHSTANRALQELTDKGFIEPRVKGAFHVKFKHATEWRLNDRQCDVTGQRQSEAFLKWNAVTCRAQKLEHGRMGATVRSHGCDTTRIPQPRSRSHG
jgi:hypothetical protein